MPKLTFYTHPMSRGRTVRWMLEECGVPYDTVLLEYGTTMKAPDYLAINPMGKVPALRHGQAVVTEVAAICAYLADLFGTQMVGAIHGRLLTAWAAAGVLGPKPRRVFLTIGRLDLPPLMPIGLSYGSALAALFAARHPSRCARVLLAGITAFGRPGDYRELAPQDGAWYDALIKVDLSKVEPMIALPFHPSNAYTIQEFQENLDELLHQVDEDTVRQLKLTNVEVAESRIEAFRPDARFDAITARALATLQAQKAAVQEALL